MVMMSRRALSRFELILQNAPQPNSLLLTKTREPVPVLVEDLSSGERGMHVCVAIDDERTGWYLSDETRGLKALILPNSQAHLIEVNGGSMRGLTVQALWILRWNKNRTALLTEVVDVEEDEG